MKRKHSTPFGWSGKSRSITEIWIYASGIDLEEVVVTYGIEPAH